MAAQHRDERQEQPAVEPVPVKLVGRRIRGRNQDQTTREQCLEQTRQDHRIGDVLDGELVEAEEPRRLRDIRSDGSDGVCRALAAVSHRLADEVDAVVNLRHEFVKVHPPLPPHHGGGEEGVHQHRLAAPDAAMDVEPADGLRLAGEQPAESAPFGCKSTLGEAFLEPVHATGNGKLGRVAGQLAGFDQRQFATTATWPQDQVSSSREAAGWCLAVEGHRAAAGCLAVEARAASRRSVATGEPPCPARTTCEPLRFQAEIDFSSSDAQPRVEAR